jgi:hypothetical protein
MLSVYKIPHYSQIKHWILSHSLHHTSVENENERILGYIHSSVSLISHEHFLRTGVTDLGWGHTSAQNASVVEINKRGECYAFFWLQCRQKTMHRILQLYGVLSNVRHIVRSLQQTYFVRSCGRSLKVHSGSGSLCHWLHASPFMNTELRMSLLKILVNTVIMLLNSNAIWQTWYGECTCAFHKSIYWQRHHQRIYSHQYSPSTCVLSINANTHTM